MLVVLARAGRPLTAGEVAAQTPRGSEIGVRKSLARLTEQGIVRAMQMGRNRVHELNRDHLAAPIADLLAGLRLELWKRLRGALATWNPKPVYACAFGSAARGDGDAYSDIDLLLVHPPLPPATEAPLVPAAGNSANPAMPPMTERQLARWRRQVDELHGHVHNWTGNHLQVLEMSIGEWADHQQRDSALYIEIHRDAVELLGQAGQLRHN